MPDLTLRLGKEMLTFSADQQKRLVRDGYTDVCLSELGVFEADTIEDLLRVEKHAGAQCVVTNTSDITRARLAHFGLEEKQTELARANFEIVSALKPQHAVVEIGPTRLPIDPDSKTSLKSNREQYYDAVAAFVNEAYEEEGEDGWMHPLDTFEEPEAFLFSDLVSLSDVRCALMAKAQKTDTPAIPSMLVDDAGTIGEEHRELAFFLDVAQDLEAAVVGLRFEAMGTIQDTLSIIVEQLQKSQKYLSIPFMLEIAASDEPTKRFGVHTAPTLSHAEDVMRIVEAVLPFRPAGVRVVGAAKPSYTGAVASRITGIRLDD